MIQRPPFKVFAGTNTRYLAEKICNSLGCELGKMNIQHFADGEFSVSFEESIRGCQVFLIQSTYPNADNLMELLLMIDAAKRASADSIIAVTPYFGWARQDRKDKPRVSIAAKLIADLLSVAGIDRLITMDLHADQIQGFFNVPVDHLYAQPSSANTSNHSNSKTWLSHHPMSAVQNEQTRMPSISVCPWYYVINREPKPTKSRV